MIINKLLGSGQRQLQCCWEEIRKLQRQREKAPGRGPARRQWRSPGPLASPASIRDEPGSHFAEEQTEAWRNGGILLMQLQIRSKMEMGFQCLGFWVSLPGSGRMRSLGARAACGGQSPPRDRTLWGDHWGKAVPLPACPQQCLGMGERDGQEIPNLFSSHSCLPFCFTRHLSRSPARPALPLHVP